jgi:hypothetical protein
MAIQVLRLLLTYDIRVVDVKASITLQQESLAFDTAELYDARRPLITHSMSVGKL